MELQRNLYHYLNNKCVGLFCVGEGFSHRGSDKKLLSKVKITEIVLKVTENELGTHSILEKYEHEVEFAQLLIFKHVYTTVVDRQWNISEWFYLENPEIVSRSKTINMNSNNNKFQCFI